MSLDLDLTSKRDRNLNVLKSISSNVFEIVEDSSHVALYKFDSSSSKWDKVDVEGSAFITRNKESPFYSLIIMNKKGPTDFVLDLNSTLKVKVQDVYVMIRCLTDNVSIIFGLWFHNDDERGNMYQALKRITANNETCVNGLTPSLSNLLQNTSNKLKLSQTSPVSVSVTDSAQKLKFSEVLTKGTVTAEMVVSPPSSAVKSSLLMSALKTSPPALVPVSSGMPVEMGGSKGMTTPPSSTGVVSGKSSAVGAQKVKGNVHIVNSSNQPNAVSAASTHFVPVSHPSPVPPSLSGVNSGSSRLLDLLKSSGRDTSTTNAPSMDMFSSPQSPPATVPVSSGSNALSAMLKSAIRVSPPSTPTPSTASTSSITSSLSAPKTAEEERNAKLLAMLRVATTSEQAMDLLTDGDIASKTKKENGSRVASPDRLSVITHSDTAPTSSGAFRDLSSPVTTGTTSSADRLMSILKSPSLRALSSAASPVAGSVASNAAVYGGSGVNSASVSVSGGSRSATPSSSVKMLSVSDLLNSSGRESFSSSSSAGVASGPQRGTNDSGVLSRSSSMKENQIRGLSSVNTSTALIVVQQQGKPPRSPPTNPLSSPPTRTLPAPLTSAEKARLLSVSRSPELRGLSPSLKNSSSSGGIAALRPVLLSPSDLMRGGARQVAV